MNQENQILDKKNSNDNEQNNNLDDIIQGVSMQIRNYNRGWLGSPGMCEVCGLHKATVNLDLTFGSHRECQFCWND